ncbi:tripartite tricarboxylate transporter substrate binding protein [Pseudomonas sp.]|jgi:tripartite-type tricarboxylate transporter receptor subunit TctC|uniref:tripartite tricarboxylate transporter substrate binding protein n=1 Tax=Pseudomonas sp. TaxID=306 RepID=UPI0025CD4740|nr:tripartite tricarboxylate transporter substrate binding protein [Pseudomonas sp.]
MQTSWRRRAILTMAVSGTFLFGNGTTQAQETYPSKPIRIVVPYPTGGFNDTLGRIVANKLTIAWKQPVIVDNRPGGGTVIGTQVVATSPADGYTLLVVQFPFAANPWLYKSLPYDSAKAFAPVVLAGRSPMLIVSNAGGPLRTLGDVLAAAKAKPGALNYGSSGPGSSNHLAMALFESVSGTRMTQVPYKGSTPLLTDLAGGQIDLAIDLLPHALPFIQSGKVRALAIAGGKRSPLMPELPTTAEAGVPGYDVTSWHGFMAPAGTPQAVIDKINHELNAIFAMDDVKKIFAQQGVVPDGGTPTQFRNFVEAQMALWKKVVQDGHITAE